MFEAFLNQNKLEFIVLTPWLFYDNYDPKSEKFIDRDTYKELYLEVADSIRKINSGIKILGAVQSNLVSLPENLKKSLVGLGFMSRDRTGIVVLNEQESHLIKESGYWQDSDYIITSKENLVAEIQYYSLEEGSIEISLAVIPKSNGLQEKYITEQIEFLTKEVGLDGVYLDQFNQNVHYLQRSSYGSWDGISFDGRRKYEDTLLTTLSFQKNILNQLSNEAIPIITNTSIISVNDSKLNHQYFYEGFGEFHALNEWKKNSKPSSSFLVSKGHFHNPVSLGIPDWLEGDWKKDYAKALFRNLIFYLRNGSLFYHNQTFFNEPEKENLYEIYNYLFPMRPKELGMGWILGEKKYISTVSRTFTWPNEKKPEILIFNEEGIKNQQYFIIEKQDKGWSIELEIHDWNEVAVIL